MTSTNNGNGNVSGIYEIPKRVLVVDDEPLIRALLTDLLVEEGYQVTEAKDGEHALKEMDKRQFDLVISDMVMPGINGIEVLLATKKTSPDTPVVMITGYPSVETVIRLVNLGAADYLTKPFNVDVVRITVAKVMVMAKSRKRTESQDETEDSLKDKATGTYSSQLFDELLTTEIGRSARRGHVCSLLVTEIDRFEDSVKKGGPDLGNELLKTLATITLKEINPGDIIGRLGSKEMAVMLPETDRNDANALAHTIRKRSEWNFTLSGGVACFPRDGSQAGDLIKMAREAVQAAKARGGNAVLLPR